jgi:hypothetical protein
MVGLQTLNLAIGVRVPASQPKNIWKKTTAGAGPHYKVRPANGRLLWQSHGEVRIPASFARGDSALDTY